MVAAGRRPLDAPRLMGGDVYWVEGRPTEGGRYVLMRQRERASQPEQLTPDGFNVRTRVHEYGGGAYAIHGETVFFVNFADQRLYRHDPGAAPRPITAEGPRFADLHLSVDGRHIYAVRERHGRGEAVNDLVVLPSDGSGEPRVLASGRDFYAFPRLSPDGKRLAWTCWDHPNLPWDGTELWVGDADASNARLVAGGPEESVFQPGWGPDGALYWVSDKAGWWQIYRDGQRLIGLEAEFGTAQWVFGLSTYAFLGDGRIACLYSQDGFDDLALLEPGGQV